MTSPVAVIAHRVTIRTTPLLLLLLVACGPDVTVNDSANATDPAIADALAGPILTDVQMTIAPPAAQPTTLLVPGDALVDTAGAPTLGELAAARVRDPAFAGCAPDITYSAQWSVRLPAPLALPKGARLSEGGGSDRPGCALRIVRFGLAGTPAAALGSYAAIAARDGYTVVKADRTLSATRARDGTAFYVDAFASNDGVRVDLMTRTR